MTDRPIIFSGPMVRALLAGRKTQTRRLATSPLRRCKPGDRLWVRETYRHWQGSASGRTAVYSADGEWWDHGSGWRGTQSGIIWCTPATRSIHMPRWASRLTLIVEAARVEPLQSICEADAVAEGVQVAAVYVPSYRRHFIPDGHGGLLIGSTAVEAYAHLWRKLHGTAGQRWEDNPDVLVLTFRVERGNIDGVRG